MADYEERLEALRRKLNSKTSEEINEMSENMRVSWFGLRRTLASPRTLHGIADGKINPTEKMLKRLEEYLS